MVGEVEEALDAGAIGLSIGLIYAPGMHAGPTRSRRWWRRRPGAAGSTRPTCATRPTACSRRSTNRSPRSAPAGRGARLQVSHLKSGSRAVWGRAGEAVAAPRGGPRGGPRRRRRPVPVHGRLDQSGRRSCRRRSWASASTSASRLSADPHVRDLVRDGDGARHLGLGERGRRPGLGRHPHRVRREPPGVGRPLARRARRRGSTPTRRTSPSMRWSTTGSTSRSSSTAWPSPTSRRSWPCPGSRSAPTPRAAAPAIRSSTPGGRTRGRTGARPASSGGTCASAGRSRSRRRSPSSPPSRPRGSACATAGSSARARSPTSSSFDPATVADEATYADPAHYPPGIEHVIVNGRPAILDGAETGERAGRLLRRS